MVSLGFGPLRYAGCCARLATTLMRPHGFGPVPDLSFAECATKQVLEAPRPTDPLQLGKFSPSPTSFWPYHWPPFPCSHSDWGRPGNFGAMWATAAAALASIGSFQAAGLILVACIATGSVSTRITQLTLEKLVWDVTTQRETKAFAQLSTPINCEFWPVSRCG